MGNGFGILFKFKIDNEKSGMMICQHLTLINNVITQFWVIPQNSFFFPKIKNKKIK